MKTLIALAMLSTVGGGGTHDGRLKSDIEIACEVWHIAKTGAIIAGLFVPGVSSVAVAIGEFVDPVCNSLAVGTVAARAQPPSDPSTPQWIAQNAARLDALTRDHEDHQP